MWCIWLIVFGACLRFWFGWCFCFVCFGWLMSAVRVVFQVVIRFAV